MSVWEHITSISNDRILMLDGAMGTMLQKQQLEEEDFRGARFADWPSPLKGNNDLLVLTKPEAVRSVHEAFLAAGADLIETNSFNATSIRLQQKSRAKPPMIGRRKRLKNPAPFWAPLAP